MSGERISWATSDGTRRSMQANKSRDTEPELAVRRLLHAAGLRFRVNYPVLPRRTADIVFTRAKVAVFIDGCFWHGCPAHYQAPSTNRDYWHDKVTKNSERDADTTGRLLGSGWTVMRFWEHEPPADVVSRVLSRLRLPS